MRVSPQFVSVGVNRVVNALDWGDNGLIAFCGHRVVCVYDPESAEVIGTLTGHTGQVNCVKWLPSSVTGCSAPVLLSGAADNTIRVWAWHGQQQSPPWTCITVLQGHESPVTSLALQPLSQDVLLLASTSADPHVRLWECHHVSTGPQQQQQPQHQQQQDAQGCNLQEQQLQARFGAAAWQLQQPVHVGRQIQHCVALATLPEDPHCVLMATGGTDSTVRLYVREGRSSASSTSSSCAGMADGHAGVLQDLQDNPAGGQHTAHLQGPGFQLQCQLKGHENWVKGVSFQHVQEAAGGHAGQHGCVSLLLASAGQDRYGRIWCISTDPNRSNAATEGGGAVAGDDFLRKMITRYAPRPHLSAGSHTYWVTLEALLIGHEDWLHSVSWRPTATPTAPAASAAMSAAAAAANGTSNGNGCLPAAHSRSDLTLLTTSQDRSMMLWSFDAPNELWLSDAAIGDAGASCLGFYGGAFNPSGDQLVAHGFTGALHLWKQQGPHNSSGSSSSSGGLWVPQHALGGHYGAVQDLAWGADGACLQTVAADQTARLFTGIRGHWFELARTQVHGHDFSCLATIPTSSSSSSSPASSSAPDSTSSSSRDQLPPACLLYVSGSEEKVLRVFEAPHAFTQSLAAVRSLQSPAAAAATAATLAAAAGSSGGSAGRALGAAVAALGLSNKAVYDDTEAGPDDGTAGGDGARLTVGAETYNEGPDFVPVAVPAVVSGPPLEEHLAQNTLWPEVRKLYGHGNDVFCVCSSPSGRVIASTCRAQSAGAAAVWVWEVGSWKALAQLSAHTLTVTQAEFSPDGRYLLTGSRDRSFCVWQVPQQYRCSDAAAAAAAGVQGSGEVSDGFELLVRQKAAHSRIIWSVSWAHDCSFFATGSRDNTVKLWATSAVASQQQQQQQQQQRPLAVLPPFPAGITAVALSPCHVSTAAAAGVDAVPQDSAAAAAAAEQVYLLAVGMEDGCVQVWRLQLQGAVAAPGVGPAGGEGGSGGQGVAQVVCERLWGSEVWQQHAAAVRRLRWAPACVSWLCDGGDGGMALASCGEDNSVRVFDVRL